MKQVFIAVEVVINEKGEMLMLEGIPFNHFPIGFLNELDRKLWQEVSK